MKKSKEINLNNAGMLLQTNKDFIASKLVRKQNVKLSFMKIKAGRTDFMSWESEYIPKGETVFYLGCGSYLDHNRVSALYHPPPPDLKIKNSKVKNRVKYYQIIYKTYLDFLYKEQKYRVDFIRNDVASSLQEAAFFMHNHFQLII